MDTTKEILEIITYIIAILSVPSATFLFLVKMYEHLEKYNTEKIKSINNILNEKDLQEMMYSIEATSSIPLDLETKLQRFVWLIEENSNLIRLKEIPFHYSFKKTQSEVYKNYLAYRKNVSVPAWKAISTRWTLDKSYFEQNCVTPEDWAESSDTIRKRIAAAYDDIKNIKKEFSNMTIKSELSATEMILKSIFFYIFSFAIITGIIYGSFHFGHKQAYLETVNQQTQTTSPKKQDQVPTSDESLKNGKK